MVTREFVDEHNRQALDVAATQDYDHLGKQLAAPGRRDRAAHRAGDGVPGGRALVGRRHRRHALRALRRARASRATSSRSSTTATSIHQLVRVTPGISLHIPWDEPEDPAELRAYAAARGLFFDSMNSNTFQDQPGQALSYKFGSLTHTDPAVRRAGGRAQRPLHRARARRSARARTRCGSATAGTSRARSTSGAPLERYLESLRAIYAALPDGFRMFIEHKLYEPAFYSTVLNDWGTSYYCTRELGREGVLASSTSATTPRTSTSR